MSSETNLDSSDDDGHWEIYVTFVDDKPAVILVDIGIEGIAPIADKPSLAWLWVTLQAPDEEGFPTEEEDFRLNEIEDVVTESIDDEHTMYVGRITADGRREFYFYTANPEAFREVATAAMTSPSAAGYQFEIDEADDPEWRHYKDVLYPSPEDFQQIRNQYTLTQLYEAGDSLIEPRPVDHFANFKTSGDREAFIVAAEEMGFETVSRPERADGTDFPYSVGFLRVDAVDAETIDNLTFELYVMAEEHGGDYEGWNSKVVKK